MSDEYQRHIADMGDSAMPDFASVDPAVLAGKLDEERLTGPLTPTPKTKPHKEISVEEEEQFDDGGDDKLDLSGAMTADQLLALARSLTSAQKHDPYMAKLEKAQKKYNRQEKQNKKAYNQGDPEWVRDMKYPEEEEELDEETPAPIEEEAVDPEEIGVTVDDEGSDLTFFKRLVEEFTDGDTSPNRRIGLLSGNAELLSQKDIDGFREYMSKAYPQSDVSDKRIKLITGYISDLGMKIVQRAVSDRRTKNIIGAIAGRVI